MSLAQRTLHFLVGRTGRARRTVAMLAILAVALDAVPVAGSPVDAAAAPVTPARLDGPVADLLVAVSGGGACTGTPIASTQLVVTAAHCVLDGDGRIGARSVQRGGHSADVTMVLVDRRYAVEPTNSLDVAVLVLDHPLPGPAASIGTAIPTSGSMTLAGFQALDTDGSLLRGTTPSNRPRPTGAHGQVVVIEHAPAGCSMESSAITVDARRLTVPCGLIPGASGGGLFHRVDDDIQLVGVVSTVSGDLAINGVAPISSVIRLLADPDRFAARADSSPTADVTVARS